MSKEFDLKSWINEEEKRHPGFKEALRKRYNNPPRTIKSNPPVACFNGEYECYIDDTGWCTDGQIQQCKICGKKYQYIMYDWVTGVRDKSGWYLQNPSVWDIIKSWFKNK